MSEHFFNGRIVPEQDIVISPRDLGFSRGYAVFDFLRTFPHHRPFKLKEHIDRLYNSAAEIDLAIPWSKKEVTGWVLETLSHNDSLQEKFIKIIVSGGISNTMLPGDGPTIVILVDPIAPYPREMYEKGVGIVTARHSRYIPTAKTNNYIEGVKQTKRGARTGAVEPLYYSDSQVFEGSNSNIFAVIDGSLRTPASGILPGITRQVLLEILPPALPVDVCDFPMTDLHRASEIFFTGSGKGVTPVTMIDGNLVGTGEVGPVTKEVMRIYNEYTNSDQW